MRLRHVRDFQFSLRAFYRRTMEEQVASWLGSLVVFKQQHPTYPRPRSLTPSPTQYTTKYPVCILQVLVQITLSAAAKYSFCNRMDGASTLTLALLPVASAQKVPQTPGGPACMAVAVVVTVAVAVLGSVSVTS